MPSPFSRDRIVERCATFRRLEQGSPANGLKRAAVALVLAPADAAPQELSILLTVRAPRLRAHGGQWALPGGRCDAGETAVEAALRESHEELGLQLDKDDVLATFDDYPTRSGYLITPVLVWGGNAPSIRPNPHEVASVHRITLGELAQEDAFDFVTIPESRRRVIRFRHRGDHIHAPTAALIYQFREVLAGRDTRVADLEQPVFAWK